jgi:hypothetical protein
MKCNVHIFHPSSHPLYREPPSQESIIRYDEERKKDKELERLDVELEKRKKRKKALGIVEEKKDPDEDVMDLLKAEEDPNYY